MFLFQVLRILKNEVYTGTMVQGRRQKINYKIKKIRDVEESGWIRVPNMHEAIIPQKLFDTVQEVLKLDTCASKGQQTVNLFSGIVRCGGCGQNMVRRTVSKNGKKYIYLHCVTNHNGLGCSSHLISESKLEEVVLAALQGKIQQISGLEHRLDEINEIPKNERRLKSVEEHLKMLEQEEQKYQTLRRQLYEDMSSGIVSKEEYKELKRLSCPCCNIKECVIIWATKRPERGHYESDSMAVKIGAGDDNPAADSCCVAGKMVCGISASLFGMVFLSAGQCAIGNGDAFVPDAAITGDGSTSNADWWIRDFYDTAVGRQRDRASGTGGSNASAGMVHIK